MNEEKSKNKPGPQTGHTVEITKPAIVIGRNKTPVPMDEVEMLASVGCNDAEIAKYFGVKDDTLRRHFADYLINGRHKLKLSLRQAQLRTALEGNVTMLIWLGKQILQQTESGASNDEVRPLPWSDDVDEVEVIDVEHEDADE